MVVVCTGSRTWNKYSLIRTRLQKLKESAELQEKTLVIYQGGAIGADLMVDSAARGLGIECRTMNADWGRFGTRAGAIRNREMLDTAQPELVIAFLNTNDNLEKSGTVDCMKAAEERGISCELITI